MTNSMTGYARVEGIYENKKVLTEIRSVNHRYADYNIKIPRYYGFLEEKVRKFVSGYISRGKVDVYIAMESCGETDREITVNIPLAGSYVEALKTLQNEFGLAGDITVSSLARYSDIFSADRKQEDADAIWNTVLMALEPAMEQYAAMRAREGQRMVDDIRARAAAMLEMVAQVEERSPQCVVEYRNKLEARLQEVLSSTTIDESRILTEAAIFADKIAVAEETVRLRSHFVELETILAAPEPSGKKLDFLIQEINREINTIGSKANDIEIARVVVDLKAELEKMREQVQNIE